MCSDRTHAAALGLSARPIRTPADYDAVLLAARADGHDPIIPPTHSVHTPAGELVGAFNVGPAVGWWLRADQGVRASLVAFQSLETLQRDRGVNRYAILIHEDSPYCRIVGSVGMRHIDGLRVLTKEA